MPKVNCKCILLAPPIVIVANMKFPRPRTLVTNEYPDITDDQPTLFRDVIENLIYPQPNSDMEAYINSSIEFLKNQQKTQRQMLKLNSIQINSSLSFVYIIIPPSTRKIKCLVDTGCSNTIIRSEIAKEIKLKFRPYHITLSTATGNSENSVKGITHSKFLFACPDDINIPACTTIIISDLLNHLDMIIGAEFLLNTKKVHSLSGSKITIISNDKNIDIPIFLDNPITQVNFLNSPTTDPSFQDTLSDNAEATASPQKLESSPNCSDDSLSIFTHSISEDLSDETLPPAEILFDEHQDLDFALLDKSFSLEDGDYTNCPQNQLSTLKNLLFEFSDRFSTSKLDLETTDLYEADLPTVPNQKVDQLCRRLPDHKYKFAMKAIKKLQASGVVRPSDSSWRSNVVMVPKPASKDDLRENTKAEYLTGHQNKSELYRLCLDFRALNQILIFPQKTQFTTLDRFLHTLKNKVVVSLDISSAFFIIPIKESDRYKTAFWVNESCFEFMVCVMGLKSSPYHLNKFLETAFSESVFQTLKNSLSAEEQSYVPSSFDECIISYFDDFFVYASDYKSLEICFKLVLMAARQAKIKFSIEKSSFFTTKIKILGYAYDTKETVLTMDKLKASAILNMKKPASLFELHSRLASLQYQSTFLPYLKHILYPLHFLLRKKTFSWGPIEEKSWQIAKQLATLNLRLTIPDPSDDLVLTTDASKIAAAACLFRIKNNKMELVAVSSKYFATTDLNKSSYMLEAISLAYALKIFSAYILNCTGSVKIFTDAKSLIFLKRNSSHSILLNSTLQYLTNFVSLVNIELYHLPGNVNILADVLSRAIANNLNCNLPKEHPISRQWAKVLPPIPDKFSVSHETLYKFLTHPLSPEPQDLYDRRHKRLMEPKSLQATYDFHQKITPEERYHNAITLLDQWNSQYAKEHPNKPPNFSQPIYAIKMSIDLEKQKQCLEKINEIMETTYADIKDSATYKALLRNLQEASKRYLYLKHNPQEYITDESYANDPHDVLMNNLNELQREQVYKSMKTSIKANFLQQQKTNKHFHNFNISHHNVPIVYFNMHPHAVYYPNIATDSNGLDLPIQETIVLKPFELQKINLKIRFQFPKNYCSLLMNKSSARIKYNIQAQLGLIDVGFADYLQTVIQNMSEETVTIEAGTALVQLLLIKSKIPTFENTWPDNTSTRGSFGSTGQNFKTIKNPTTISKNQQTAQYLQQNYIQHNEFLQNYSVSTHPSAQFLLKENTESIHPILQLENIFSPNILSLDSFHINLTGTPLEKSQQLFSLKAFEADLLLENSSFHSNPLPQLQVYHTSPAQIPSSPNTLPPSPTNTVHPTNYPDNIHPTNTELSALLAADLADNKKLSLPSLIYFQNHDPLIQQIKDDLLGKKSFNSFTLHKGIVCKIFSEKHIGPNKLAIYIPSALLTPVLIYLHKHFLHPSKTQTFREFAALYYHPRAKQTSEKICKACLTCSMSRNVENKNIHIGQQRSLQPTKPRQIVSMDILYLPTSSKGHTHALMIADMFSLYVSFFPLKTKSSAAIATALRSFISLQGLPEVIYTDNDPSFQGEVDHLLQTYNIQHSTSYPYTQKNNTVESQVRLLKNAYRSLIQDNPICTHREWHILYPLVIIRLNTMISKYGLSRELVHFQQTNETHLPLITSLEDHSIFSEHLDYLSKTFQKNIGAFLRNKQKSKEYYGTNKKIPFLLHELVMRKQYTPQSALHPTFVGPLRIIQLHPQGALLKDPRTGETFSVHHHNMRKLHIDEFLSLLPTNFDSDILTTMQLYRYNKSNEPEKPANYTPQQIPDEFYHPFKEAEDLPAPKGKVLRSGKILNNNISIPIPFENTTKLEWNYYNKHSPVSDYPTKSILKPFFRPLPTPYASVDQMYCNNLWMYKSTFADHPNNLPLPNYKTRYKSSFQSKFPGTLTIKLNNDFNSDNRCVQFSELTVHFY
jgi:dUTPase